MESAAKVTTEPHGVDCRVEVSAHGHIVADDAVAHHPMPAGEIADWYATGRKYWLEIAFAAEKTAADLPSRLAKSGYKVVT